MLVFRHGGGGFGRDRDRDLGGSETEISSWCLMGYIGFQGILVLMDMRLLVETILFLIDLHGFD